MWWRQEGEVDRRFLEQLGKRWRFESKKRKQVCGGSKIGGRRFWRRVKNRPSRKELGKMFWSRVEVVDGVIVGIVEESVGVLVVVEKRFGKCISGKWKKDTVFVQIT